MTSKIKQEKNNEPRFILIIDKNIKLKKPISDEVLTVLAEYGNIVLNANIKFHRFIYGMVSEDEFKIQEKEIEKEEQKILRKLEELKVPFKETKKIIKEASDQAEKFFNAEERKKNLK